MEKMHIIFWGLFLVLQAMLMPIGTDSYSLLMSDQKRQNLHDFDEAKKLGKTPSLSMKRAHIDRWVLKLAWCVWVAGLVMVLFGASID